MSVNEDVFSHIVNGVTLST